MLSEILQPATYGRRDRRRYPRRQGSEMLLPHHFLGLSASNRGRTKQLPFAGGPHQQQRSLGLRIQKEIEVAVCQREVQKELSQRGPLNA